MSSSCPLWHPSLLHQPPMEAPLLTRQKEETTGLSDFLLVRILSTVVSAHLRPGPGLLVTSWHKVSIFAFHGPASGSAVTWWDIGNWGLRVSPHWLSLLPSFGARRGLVALHRSRGTACPGLPGMWGGERGDYVFPMLKREMPGKVPGKQGQIGHPTNCRGLQKTVI